MRKKISSSPIEASRVVEPRVAQTVQQYQQCTHTIGFAALPPCLVVLNVLLGSPRLPSPYSFICYSLSCFRYSVLADHRRFFASPNYNCLVN